MLFILSGFVLACAVIFGGATRSGYIGDVAVQLLSVPLLGATLWPAFSAQDPHRHKARLAFYVCGIAAFLMLIQVVPLPFDVWPARASFLPGSAVNSPMASNTLSVAPQATWAAAASFIAPLAVFSAVTQLGGRHRETLARLLLGLGAAALMLGFLQVAQGPASKLRFYDFTNLLEAVGLFANRNHFAAHLCITLVLAGVWFASTADSLSRRGTFNSKSFLSLAAAAAFLTAVLAGLALARSRAGTVLAMIALAGVFALMLTQPRLDRARGAQRHSSPRRASIAVLLFGYFLPRNLA